ncbi:Cupin domain-containing protein [Cladophialophora immunda]|nr:Cupin domain-containing protein [Cladophialophora immunda]
MAPAAAPKDGVTPHSDLRQPTNFITGNRADGKATMHSSEPGEWQNVRETNYFNVVYTSSEFPVEMSGDKDIKAHQDLMAQGTLGLVRPNGTVCRMVDLKPHGPSLMHRTQSLDYGIVVEGEIELHLDSGEVHYLKRGDVAVQRGTMHEWRNTSDSWTRIVFVLTDAKPIRIGNETFGEDLGGHGWVPPSGH